jgi:putative hydrolase
VTSAVPGERICVDVDATSDLHTHSDLTDGSASPEAMADAAQFAGLTTWGLSDHVRATSTWIPEYVARVRGLHRDGMTICCGVEAKILDARGHLDLPADARELDYVLVADHQFPSVTGPRHPREMMLGLTEGDLAGSDVVDELVAATCAAVRRAPFRPIVVHPFSLLPKMGLAEDLVRSEHVTALAAACSANDGAVEINEKWRCPSGRVLAELARAGVTLVAGSDAHRPADIGGRSYLDEVLDAGDCPAGNRRVLADR